MDDLQRFNRDRWNALARGGIAYARPWLGLTPEAARQRIDPYGMLGDLAGQAALVLSGGGGQQSVALALLGAQVTVLDLSDEQLKGDRTALDQYGLNATLLQGDMRDLSALPADAFDLVLQPYAINFVPEVAPVIREVARVLRPGGLYQLTWGNPFTRTVDDRSWNGSGYLLSAPYADGELRFDDDLWEVVDDAGEVQRIVGPREFNHTLSTMLNTLAAHEFRLLRLVEAEATWYEEPGDPVPGSWWHLLSVAPPFLTAWLRLDPVIGQGGRPAPGM